MLRNIAAVIAGLVVGMLVNMALVLLNTVIFPLPDGVTMADSEALGAAVRDMPAVAWILVFAAHLGQAFVGGWVAARLGASRPLLLAMVVGVISLLGGIMNAVQLQTPAWTWIEMPLYLIVAWFAGSLVAKSRGAA